MHFEVNSQDFTFWMRWKKTQKTDARTMMKVGRIRYRMGVKAMTGYYRNHPIGWVFVFFFWALIFLPKL